MSDSGNLSYPVPKELTGKRVLPDTQQALREAVEEVMDVESITTGTAENPITIRGKLTYPSHEAFKLLRPRFEAVGHTPLLRQENDQDVVRALPTVFGEEKRPIPWINIIMLAATVISVFLVGTSRGDGIYVGSFMIWLTRLTNNPELFNSELFDPKLLPTDEVWRAALKTGFFYMLSLLGILGTHEMGHYLTARYHKVNTTLPFFIPLPIGLGTMGAVIAMREPSANRRVQFDIGVAGPLAGLVVAIPVLLIGLSLSEVGTIAEVLTEMPAQAVENLVISREGQSLTYLGLKYLIFGEILPNGPRDVWIHPVALAGWAGLLVTALNLLPIGQLDGGHVLYGLFGKDAAKARQPIILVLVILAIFGTIQQTVQQIPPEALDSPTMLISMLRFLALLPVPGWSGWWIWILLIMFLVRGHAPVLDEITELDPRRKAIGVAMLVIFILIFTPVPWVEVEGPLAMMWQYFI